MKKSFLALVAAAACMVSVQAKDINVKSFRYAGPYKVSKPVMIDSVGLDSKAFKPESLLDTPLKLSLAQSGQVVSDSVFSYDGGNALHLLGFQVQNQAYAKAKVSVKGLKNYQIFVDGAKANGESNLQPGTHEVTVKFLTTEAGRDTISVQVATDSDLAVGTSVNSGKQLLTMNKVYDGRRIGWIWLSNDGRYSITSYTETLSTGKSATTYLVTEVKSGRTIEEINTPIRWMPRSCRYYYTQPCEGGRRIVTVDPSTGNTATLAEGLPNDSYTIAPNEKFLILSHMNEGAKEGDRDVHQYLEPDDRQPGWRNRYSLTYYDIETGMTQPLTYGHHSASLQDISEDCRYVYFMTSRSRLTERPTTLMSILRIDLQTMKADTIVKDNGFIASMKVSPDGRTLAVKASPEAFGGIGVNVSEGRTPSMYDYQLFLVDVATGHATALTRTFNPSIEDYRWGLFDSRLYFSALDRDCINFFTADPKTLKIERISLPEEAVRRFSQAGTQPLMAWTGVSASNSTRSYMTNLKTRRTTLVEDQHQRLYGDVLLGRCEAWDYVNSRGDTICGRYYLPPTFDSTKKYPMLVYYYGGCSPTSRYFESGYMPHLYAAQGYVVYVVNPSGAAGFGQEHASRHVNTAGDFVADDIIEGTKRFAAEHPWVDAKHIGCLGASYGGFMTQYLQTKTDIFAAAMSHAGISDHTSYWGEGYWGYSYSETSMANSYPWTRKDLYVDHSPLYNADKIHTPILFLHGTADTNVPIGESIQMYTALKLLGRETAFVVVEGENHWIQDYKKREKWQATINAWFQKWLKEDSTWWDSLYPEKAL